jgi:hypothetical protein
MSPSATKAEDFMLRLRLRDFPVKMCAPPAEVRLIFPPAVLLNRLATAFFVFCFGIPIPLICKREISRKRVYLRHSRLLVKHFHAFFFAEVRGMPLLPGSALVRGERQGCKTTVSLDCLSGGGRAEWRATR